MESFEILFRNSPSRYPEPDPRNPDSINLQNKNFRNAASEPKDRKRKVSFLKIMMNLKNTNLSFEI